MKINEKTGLYENYGLWHVPFWQTEKFQLIVKISCAVLVLLFIAILIKKYCTYRKNKKLSAWDQALFDLRVLRNNNKVSVEHGKEFYLTVSALLKKYLYERFKYDVLGKTDSEVVHFLKEHHADEQTIIDFEALLHGGITIKFANAQVAQEQIENDYVRAIAIVTRTIPKKK